MHNFLRHIFSVSFFHSLWSIEAKEEGKWGSGSFTNICSPCRPLCKRTVMENKVVTICCDWPSSCRALGWENWRASARPQLSYSHSWMSDRDPPNNDLNKHIPCFWSIATGFGSNWDSRGLDLVTWLRHWRSPGQPKYGKQSFSNMLPSPPPPQAIWPSCRYLGWPWLRPDKPYMGYPYTFWLLPDTLTRGSNIWLSQAGPAKAMGTHVHLVCGWSLSANTKEYKY